jgi:hypothetical protein
VKRRTFGFLADRTRPSDDGINDAAWNLLCELLEIAHRGDVEAQAENSVRWKQVPSWQEKLARLYLWYLLKLRLFIVMGRAPSAGELQALAEGIYPRFSIMVTCQQDELVDTFRGLFALPTPKSRPDGGKFLLIGSVALGVLLATPAEDLGELRPQLAKWIAQNQDLVRIAIEGK